MNYLHWKLEQIKDWWFENGPSILAAFLVIGSAVGLIALGVLVTWLLFPNVMIGFVPAIVCGGFIGALVWCFLFYFALDYSIFKDSTSNSKSTEDKKNE